MQLGEVKQYFSMLPVGSAIVKLAERYYKPFLIQVPFVELKQETVTDQEIKNMMQKKSNTRQEYEKFKQSSSIINVTKELERVNQIFKATGVDTMSVEREIQRIIIEQPKPGLAEKQRAMAQIAQQAIDKERKERERAAIESKRKIIPRAFLTNHLQAYIVDYLRAQMKKGYSLQILKQHLLNQGYKPFDILKAISHIRNVPEDLQSRTGLEVEEFKPEEQSYPVQDAQQLVRPEPEIVQHQEKNTPSYSLTQKQKQVLELISKYPYLGTAQVYQYLGLSARKGNELRKQLIDMGLLKVEEQRNEKGWKKILALTKQANTALENPVIIAE